jgi:hypothetical protein
MNGIQVLDRPASQNFYAVAGRLLFVQYSDLRLATRIEQLFSGWQLTPVPNPDPHPDIKISFSISDDLPGVPGDLNGGLNKFEVADGGRCYTFADGFFLVFENSFLCLEAKDASTLGPQASRLLLSPADANGSSRRDACGPRVNISVWLTRTPGPTEAELARVTSFAVCAALRRFGLFELHSAGVVTPETQSGVLIIGPSGSGKSTLTLQLASAGWGYLSDDEVLLSVTDNEVEARGFRSFFALAPSTPVNGRSKTCFEPENVFTAPRADRAAPQYLLFTSISGANETQWRELTQAETMTRLIRACPWASYDTLVAGPYLEILSRLARQAKGINLMAGTDLLDASSASRIVGSVCR